MDELKFLQSRHFQAGGALHGRLFDLVLTDKPYGVFTRDGNSTDEEIPDDDIEPICQLWADLSSPTATYCVRLHPWQLGKWKNAMVKAGIYVEQHPTRTIKDTDLGKWQRRAVVGQQGGGDIWIVGHRVLC